jgi:ornithine carbamoyltransferase
MSVRHFLSLKDFSRDEIEALIERAIELKAWRSRGYRPAIFERKTLAMIFEKSSTRTRVSFEAAMSEGGGSAIFLSTHETQLGRGEPPEDTARVLAQMSDAIMIRTYEHSIVERFAASSRVPVINGLTNDLHPCQLLADLMTFFEHRGSVRGRTVAWIGDGNNMCNSYINAAEVMGFNLRVACPADYQPALANSPNVDLFTCAAQAANGADLVVTDVWASMGQEDEAQLRRDVFRPFQVTADLIAEAAADALFMHCLPAHRGEEVAAEVIDDPNSVVWDEAGNRLHAQKALLEFLFSHTT